MSGWLLSRQPNTDKDGSNAAASRLEVRPADAFFFCFLRGFMQIYEPRGIFIRRPLLPHFTPPPPYIYKVVPI